jgi:hypothetical protein
MAVKKNTTDNTPYSKTTKPTGSNNFPKAYMRFRTMLDGLEITALRYCLKDKNAAKRIARAEELAHVLMPIITEYQNKMNMDLQVDCPDGFNNCGGCCVPYDCP